jgi:hypothetical protein
MCMLRLPHYCGRFYIYYDYKISYNVFNIRLCLHLIQTISIYNMNMIEPELTSCNEHLTRPVKGHTAEGLIWHKAFSWVSQCFEDIHFIIWQHQCLVGLHFELQHYLPNYTNRQFTECCYLHHSYQKITGTIKHLK